MCNFHYYQDECLLVWVSWLESFIVCPCLCVSVYVCVCVCVCVRFFLSQCLCFIWKPPPSQPASPWGRLFFSCKHIISVQTRLECRCEAVSLLRRPAIARHTNTHSQIQQNDSRHSHSETHKHSLKHSANDDCIVRGDIIPHPVYMSYLCWYFYACFVSLCVRSSVNVCLIIDLITTTFFL